MNTFRNISLASALLATTAVPTMAAVYVISPGNGSTVGTSFSLNADATTCSSQPVAAMGYSLDNGSDIGIVHSTVVQATLAAGAGTHTVHVKAWGNKGAVCVTDATITVTGSSSVVPAYATSVSNIQNLGSWHEFHDGGTGGLSGGVMSMVGSPSRSGNARKFVTSYINYGGELYSASFGDDTTAENFFYDAWVYIAGSNSNIANLEMDMNQVMPNGQTVIYGFQCDGWSGTWDYTMNKGTPTSPVDAWVHSKAPCNPRNWGVNQWHHVQISYSRDGSGNVCYKSVWLDGKVQNLYVIVPSAFALGWAPSLMTNFQVDGLIGNLWGSSTVYVDNLTVYRW